MRLEFHQIENFSLNMMVQETEFEISGLKLAAKIWQGSTASKKTIVALHGWMDNANSFAPMAEYLKEYKIISLDLAGHGMSDHRPAGVAYYLTDYVLDVFEVIKQLQDDSVVIMGHSMGAGVATYLATIAPEKISHCVLIEGLASPTYEVKEFPKLLRQSADEREKYLNFKPKHHSSYEVMVRGRMYGMWQLSEKSSDLLCQRAVKQSEEGFCWRTDPKLKQTSPLRLTDDAVDEFMNQVTQPILLIQGSDGVFKLREQMRNRLAAYPNIKAIPMEGGHHLHMEGAEQQICSAIDDFLNTPL